MKLSFEYLKGLISYDDGVTVEFIVKKHTINQLRDLLREEKVGGYSRLKKADLVELVISSIYEKQLSIDDIETKEVEKEQLLLPAPVDIDSLKTKLRKNSLKAYYFTQIWDKSNLKKKFRELSKILHPDMSTGNSNAFDDMKKEYDIRKKLIGFTRIELETVYSKDINEMIEDYLDMNMSLSVEYAGYEVDVLENERGIK
ncbi:MAG: hypothetical protein ACRC18_06795 [Cetobacterium sp.]